MKALTDANILVIGSGDEKFSALANELTKQNAVVYTKDCTEITSNLITELNTKLIILSHLNKDKKCYNLFSDLKSDATVNSIPVLTLVNETPDEIQKVLMCGAADYITISESTESIIDKIEAVLGEGNMFSSSSALDITPIEANVSATGIRVFVVEDDPLLRNLLSIRLDKSSFLHEFSKDGKDVVSKMKIFKPDTIVLDLMLPGIDGFEILAELKEDPKLKEVPVIVFSNRDSYEDKQRALSMGADCFYIKAMTDLSELIVKIESLVLEKEE